MKEKTMTKCLNPFYFILKNVIFKPIFTIHLRLLNFYIDIFCIEIESL